MPENKINAIKKRLHTIRPPLFLSVFAAVIFSTLSLLHITTDLFRSLPALIEYTLYVCAAVCLFFAVWAIVLSLKKSKPKQKILALAEKNGFTANLTQSYTYRTIIFTYVSLIINVLLTLSKMLTGWFYFSKWLMVLSGYYIILCLSKFLLIQYERKQIKLADEVSVMMHEWKAYRLCGIMLLIMTTFLQGVVIMIVKDGMGFSYDEIVLIAIAAYDFYCLINAVVYMIAQRKNHSPLVNAIKSVSLASSLVAILSLQTAMFASYSIESDVEFRQLLNILTGTAVCVLMIGLGVFMIIKANKELKRTKTEELK